MNTPHGCTPCSSTAYGSNAVSVNASQGYISNIWNLITIFNDVVNSNDFHIQEIIINYYFLSNIILAFLVGSVWWLPSLLPFFKQIWCWLTYLLVSWNTYMVNKIIFLCICIWFVGIHRYFMFYFIFIVCRLSINILVTQNLWVVYFLKWLLVMIFHFSILLYFDVMLRWASGVI